MKKSTIIYSLLLLFSTCASLSVTAQKKIKYEDLLPGIINDEPAVAVAKLKALQKEDPENPSIYLQLALIYDRRFKKSNPITDYKKAMANITLAKVDFANCDKFLTEKEVKKNKEEYINFAVYDEKGKFNVSIDSILSRMDEARTEMSDFEVNMPGIYDDFTKSYIHYDKANKIFTDIIGSHSTLKDLLLLYDDKMELDFGEIQENYGLSLKHFENFKQRTDTFDINYHQVMKIDSIDIYKLDGLAVEINFLEHEEIPIWNYAKWVDQTRAYISSNIVELRSMMIENEKTTSKKIEQVPIEYANGTLEPLQIDKEFLFTLRKYDLNSVVEPLFIYKEKKHALLHHELVSQQISQSTEASPDRKVFSYGQLLNLIRESDTVLQNVQKRNTEFSFQKYKGFITKYYTGQAGIEQLIVNEREENNEQFDKYINSIQTLSKEMFSSDSVQKSVKYIRISIPDYTSQVIPDSILTSDKITTHKSVNIDGSAYLGGVFRHKTTQLVTAFICRKEPGNTVSWYKEFVLQINGEEANTHTLLGAMTGGPGGCTFVLNGMHKDSGAKMNALYSYSDEGEQLSVRNLDIIDYPRTIEFEEQTNTFLIGFNGRDQVKSTTESSNVILASYNVIGDLQWQYSQELIGDISAVVSVDDGYVISGNFSRMKDQSGKFIRIENGFSTYLIKLNNKGDFTKQQLLQANQSYYTTHYLKAGDHCINLFGSTNVGQQNFENDPLALVHFIVNKDLDIISRNIQ